MLIAICNIWMFQPIVSTLHELGHALPALLLTRGKVKVRVGEGKKFLFFSPGKLGKRFSIKISLKNPRVGYTQFEQQKKGSQFIVLLGGPLFTFLLTWQAGDLLFARNLAGWAEVLLISWFCGNFLALLRSLIPTYLKPTGKFPWERQAMVCKFLLFCLGHHPRKTSKWLLYLITQTGCHTKSCKSGKTGIVHHGCHPRQFFLYP